MDECEHVTLCCVDVVCTFATRITIQNCTANGQPERDINAQVSVTSSSSSSFSSSSLYSWFHSSSSLPLPRTDFTSSSYPWLVADRTCARLQNRWIYWISAFCTKCRESIWFTCKMNVFNAKLEFVFANGISCHWNCGSEAHSREQTVYLRNLYMEWPMARGTVCIMNDLY